MSGVGKDSQGWGKDCQLNRIIVSGKEMIFSGLKGLSVRGGRKDRQGWGKDSQGLEGLSGVRKG